MRTAAEILEQAGLHLPSYEPGRHYTTCPRCSASRSRAHRKAKTVGVTIDERGVCWGCSHCNWTGPEKGAGKGNGHQERRGAAAAYHEYADADGVVLARKVRNWPGKEPKCWWQHPDGKGGWSSGTGGARLPLYRLLELIEDLATEHTIAIPEGEKCVDSLRAIGMPATCNPDGAAKPDQQPKWRVQYSEQLRNADLVVMPDHDEQGYAHAGAIARMSTGLARRVRMLKLAEHWPQCPKGGDIADWLAAGHTREELDALIERAPDWRAGEEAEQQASVSLPLTFFSDLSEQPPAKPWLIKGVLARDETSSWIAPPGKGKSALLTDIAVHKAAGRDWRGFCTKGPSGVVYFALERADLVRRRLIAHRQRDGLGDLPIAVCSEVVDLLNRNCVDAILATIRAAEQRFACEVGLAIFDTYAKGIAAGGGDEDKAKDQNLVQANLRRLFARGCHIHIAGIGHTGKDESRGERGSNARLADVDLQVQITGDLVKTATITKANDQPEGALTAFRLEPFEFGPDEDGEPFRTFILSQDTCAGERATSRQKPSDRQLLALRALAEVTLSKGRDPPPNYQLPAGIKVVDADAWRDELTACNALDRKAGNPWARFTELRNSMAARCLIGSRDDVVWALRSA